MFKRFFQITVAFVAVGLFVLAPIACQQAEQPADTTETAKPAAHPSGKQLRAATPKQAKEAVEDAAEAVEGAVEEGAEAVEGAVEEGAEAVKDATKGH